MRFKNVGNKADLIATVIRNNDPNSTAILAGAPVFYIPNTGGGQGTVQRGVDVQAADAVANANHGFFAGFNLSGKTLNLGDFGEAIGYGYTDYARILLSTRATTTDVWASYAAIVIGDIFSFVSTSGVQAVQRSAAGSATNLAWWIMAGQTIASATTQASSATITSPSAGQVGNSTALVNLMRVQVRAI